MIKGKVIDNGQSEGYRRLTPELMLAMLSVSLKRMNLSTHLKHYKLQNPSKNLAFGL